MALHPPKFLGWSKPLATAAAELLITAGKSTFPKKQLQHRPIDLGSHRILVPSSFASRLIQEELAKLTSNPSPQKIDEPFRSIGILLPVLQTPDQFLNWGDNHIDSATIDSEIPEIIPSCGPVASQEICLLAWIEILTHPNFSRSNYPALFPSVSTEGFTFDEANQFALQLMQLRDQLGTSREGHDFAKIASLIETNSDRWLNLHRLEEEYFKVLNRLGQRDHNQVRTQLAKSDGMPEGVTDVWLIGLIDPQPLLIEALDRRKDRFAIHILIGADESDAPFFDCWGRPDPHPWLHRQTPWPNFKEAVHLATDPAHAAEKISELIGATKPVYGTLAVAPCERETYPELIANQLHKLGAESINPLGELHSKHVVHHRIHVLLDALEKPNLKSLRRVLRHPALCNSLTQGLLRFHSLNTLLDALSQLNPPESLEEIIQFIRSKAEPAESDGHDRFRWEQIMNLDEPLTAILDTFHKLASLPARDLTEKLLVLTLEKNHSIDPVAAEFVKEVAETIEQTLHTLCTPQYQLTLSPIQWVRLALSLAGKKRFRKNFSLEPVNLPGWIEAPWDPVPHLIVFGLTDDLIPHSNHSHSFLPAKLRAKLGLATEENHFANAAYSLERLRRSRETMSGDRSKGRFDIILPRFNVNGDGLRPSRLLFQCTDQELSMRVQHLYEQPLQAPPEPYWNIPPKLRFAPSARPDQAQSFQRRISATAFKDYLSNPADFWLKNALGMRKSGHELIELDRAGFGTLLHEVLEMFGKDSKMHKISDNEIIAYRLSELLDTHFNSSFGSNPQPGLIFQRETARERLRAFAQLQASLVDEGWVIAEVEGRLPILNCKGIEVGGRFDRLDFHPSSNTWRVYDYKSFDEIIDPATKHYTKLKSNTRKNPDFHFTTSKILENKKTKDESFRWDDLQLAVYHRNLSTQDSRIQGHPLQVGYIILPSTGNATAILWNDFDEIKNFASDAIDLICHRIAHLQPEYFQPTPKPAKYPVLDAFKRRKTEDYLDTTMLGTIRSPHSKPTT